MYPITIKYIIGLITVIIAIDIDFVFFLFCLFFRALSVYKGSYLLMVV